jgi:hypothetical protein
MIISSKGTCPNAGIRNSGAKLSGSAVRALLTSVLHSPRLKGMSDNRVVVRIC